jgi:hypothetical protein
MNTTKTTRRFNATKTFDKVVDQVGRLAWEQVIKWREDAMYELGNASSPEVVGEAKARIKEAYPGAQLAGKAYAEGRMNSKLGRQAMEVVDPADAVRIVMTKGWENDFPFDFLMIDMRHTTCCEASPSESCLGLVVSCALMRVLGDAMRAYCAVN